MSINKLLFMALHPKTLLLLHSGEVKALDQLSEGELLMGIDSTPRRVQKIEAIGSVETVEITPRQNRGATIIASWNQILVLSKAKFFEKPYGLKLLSGEIRWKRRYPSWKGRTHVAVADVLGKTYLGFGKNFKLVKVPVDFSMETPAGEGEKRLEPYFLGLWLRDGTSCRPEITTMDPEVIEYLEGFAKYWGARLRTSEKKNNKAFSLDLTFSNVKGGPWKGRNKIMSALFASNLIENKHIPDSYLFATRGDRLQLLAGIVDTDGHLQGKVFSIIQKNERLAGQIKFLADSLGFRANVRKKTKHITKRNFKGTYFEVTISGELHIVPTLIPRKKASLASARYDRKEIGFTVKKIGECNLIEIEVEGNGIFLLSDCTLIGGRREDTRKSNTNNLPELDKPRFCSRIK
jgi:replicative DNA helicase